MQADDMYAIAAQTQRMPGFGFATEGGPILRAQYEYASILRRFGAHLLDCVVIFLGALFIVIGLLVLDRLTGGTAEHASGTVLIMLVAFLAFTWLYHAGFETSTAQATLGKQLLGIKVVTLSGGRMGVPQATVRWLCKALPGVHAIVGVVCVLANILCLVMNSSQNRTLHDVIAGTVVIRG